ncbi:MAG: hypothetical protein HQM11_13320 [SAR324 cluster bacterium]|nr:hypothetical protein [SAR324 cluster bacterium]
MRITRTLLLIWATGLIGCFMIWQGSAYALDVPDAEELLRYNPIPQRLEEVSQVSNRSLEEVMDITNRYYRKIMRGKRQNLPEVLEGIHHFLISYNAISAARFRRKVLKLDSQRDVAELNDYIMQSVWYKRFLIPVATQPLYGYSHDQPVRITLAAHTGSHFFQIPYPTMMCLLFQESKFDFNVRSYTGALGLGQITSIALEQIKKLRENPDIEKRMQAAAIHLRNIYLDPMVNQILKDMGTAVTLGDLGEFPVEVIPLKPDISSFITEVQQEIVAEGISFGSNEELMTTLVQRILRGDVLSGKHAVIHSAVSKIAEQRYGKSYGSVLNLETNILTTSLLLRYYLNYPWRLEGKRIYFRPSVRAIVAVAAYNQGEGTVMNWLGEIKNNFPDFDFETAELKDFQPLFTKSGLEKVLNNSTTRAREAFSHIWNITACTEGIPEIQYP